VDNPIAVSMECIPPPCSKIREGKGVVTDVRIIDPGNGFPKVRPDETPITYPVVNRITGFNILNPGINYGPGDLLKVEIPDADPVLYNLELTPFGGISKVLPPGPGDPLLTTPDISPPDPPVTEWPDITIIPPPPPGPPLGTPPGPPGPPPGTPPGPPGATVVGPPAGTPTGVNAHIVPIIKSQVLLPDGIDPRTGLPIPPAKIIQVTDLAGIKRTGFYNGKPYYGAVFYKEGVRYAGYYETAGVLIQIYSTLQESIDATVTTPPSAIQRQGTDISSNDPRLDIPGTPQ
jgi:hypothetical protein